ncbi:MAG: molybdopterin cofactor-binding domain-containing protein, partial [Brevibacterium aurantiacum]
ALSSKKTVTWEELINAAYFQRIQLSASGFYRTEGLHWDLSLMTGEPFKYFAYGAAASEVEVNRFDGSYRLRRVDIVHDVGDSLSPLIDLGQIEGGFVQGAGWLTLEDLRWDESDKPSRGRLATQAASTYKIPSFSEAPEVFNVSLLDKAHEEGAVYGSKAVGEPPLMLAFSVREALRDAVAAFGEPGRSVELNSPATPESVFWAIESVRSPVASDASVPGDAAQGSPEGISVPS